MSSELEEAQAPEPVPATFDAMAAVLMSWPLAGTLEHWAQSPAPPSRKWDARRKQLYCNEERRVALTWAEIHRRLNTESA